MRGILVSYSLIWSLLLVSLGLSPAVAGGSLLLVLTGIPLSLYFGFQLLKYLALRSRQPEAGQIMTADSGLTPVQLSQHEHKHVHYHYHQAESKEVPVEPEPALALASPKQGVSDLDRRAFLKLIGSAGMAVFILQLFSGKAQAAFFGSVPGPGTISVKDSSGTVIDPAKDQPTDGYRISEIDDTPATTQYFGFVNKDGAWYIQREDTVNGTYRYAKGGSSFATNWSNRASLTYDYFDSVF